MSAAWLTLMVGGSGGRRGTADNGGAVAATDNNKSAPIHISCSTSRIAHPTQPNLNITSLPHCMACLAKAETSSESPRVGTRVCRDSRDPLDKNILPALIL